MHRFLAHGLTALLILISLASVSRAAPYAAIVIDARDGKVLHSRNADARLHPASLTKMMTLYLVFEAIGQGKLSLDQRVTISRNAASEPPSRIGLRAGQRVTVRELIRAAAIKSANDAATALGEAVAGSEDAFARMMTAKAAAMGMRNTQFRNAHGLTASGHYSSARDMSLLSRHLLFDFPQYYNIFGRTSTRTMGKTIYNTNRRLLGSYPGADGIKTGYTSAAGFNLAASAMRGQERIIVVVFGGRSSRQRNAKVAELLDLGFRAAPSQVATVKPNAIRPTAVRRSQPPEPRGDLPETLLSQSVRAIGEAVAPTAAAAEVPDSALLSSSRHAPSATLEPRERPMETVQAMLSDSDFAVLRAPRPRARSSAVEAWTVELGAFKDRNYAQRVISRVAEQAPPALQGAKGSVEQTEIRGLTLYSAKLSGATPVSPEEACVHLRQIRQTCRPAVN